MPSPKIRAIILSQAISPQAAAFLARTTALGGIYRGAAIKLINGLVQDGIWANLDILYIFATQDSTNALLNAVSSSFTPTLTGTPTFTVGQGYTGLVGANNFVNGPAQNGMTLFLRNTAHSSVWMWAGTSANNGALTCNGVQCVTPNNGGTAAARINESTGAATGTTANAGRGFYLGSRDTSTSYALYVNGVQAGTDTTASIATSASTYQIPQSTSIRGPISLVTFGNAADLYQQQLYNRCAEYMLKMPGAIVP